jgi:site-specific DNA recombinase
MRIAFYARVSTERQQHAQTIEQQIAQLQAYVAAQAGWTVSEEHIFRDDGYSGAKLDRPGLDAVRDQAARAAFDVVLITAPDRLARKFVHQMVVLEELERRGVRVIFIDRPVSDDPHEHLVAQIRGAVAEYERTLIADRMRRGRLSKLRSGQLLPWTRAPYGYRLHPERPRDPAAVQVDPAAGAVVQELFATSAAGEVTLHTLATQLTERQVPTATGKAIWTPCTIRQILTNPAYKGEAASGRLRTTPARGRRSALEPVGHGVSTRVHPSQEWITVPVPALVSSEQFDAVQRRLAVNQQAARRSTTHPYLLRGLVSCGVCQLSCTGMTRTPDETRYRYYRCRGKLTRTSSGRASLCPARLIPAAQLDALVWADLCMVLQHPEIVAHALERAQSGAWVPEELRRRQTTLRGVRASLVRQRERLLQAYLAEVVDLATFQRQDRTLRQQEEDLRAREREVVAQGERLVEISGLARSMLAVLGRLRIGLEQATFEQRRQLVELLIDRVVVTDGAVEIRYVIPTTENSTHSRFCHLRNDYFDGEPTLVPMPDLDQVGGQ